MYYVCECVETLILSVRRLTQANVSQFLSLQYLKPTLTDRGHALLALEPSNMQVGNVGISSKQSTTLKKK